MPLRSSRDIAYEVLSGPSSKAPAIILIMGYSGSRLSWSQNFLTLLRKKFNVIIFDNRGTGESTKPKDKKPYEIEELALDLKSVIDSVNFNEVSLMGYSLGGCICYEFICSYSEKYKIKEVFLVSTKLGRLGGNTYVPPPANTLVRLENPQGKNIFDFFRWVWEICMSKENVDKHLETLKSTIPNEKDLMTPRHVLSAQLNTYKNFDRTENRSFPFPITIITGDSDPLTPHLNSEKIQEIILGSKLKSIQECEHMPHIEKPEILSNLLACSTESD